MNTLPETVSSVLSAKLNFMISLLENSCTVMMISQRWVCNHCQRQVSTDVKNCPVCRKENKSNELFCPSCTLRNPSSAICCQVCDYPFNFDFPRQEPVKDVMYCSQCNFENSLSNENCVACDTALHEKRKKCEICQVSVLSQQYQVHQKSCRLTHDLLVQEDKEDNEVKRKEEMQTLEMIEKENRQFEEQQRKLLQRAMKNLMDECVHCHLAVESQSLTEHERICPEKGKTNILPQQRKRLTKLQVTAIEYMHNKSEKEHNSVKQKLVARMKKLGYSLEDPNNLQYYIENHAPIIIHINVSKHMQFFIKDTHYRSQFETNKSSGSLSRPSRITWEDRMFDQKYSKASDFERVKYGVVNFTNDPKGVSCCASYGQSYFLLKEHVRQRCTFTDRDSSASNAAIATFKYCFKIVSSLTDDELMAAFNAARANEVSSKCTATYKEIQIHGPIQFSKDIERIYVNKNEVKGQKELLDMVYAFSEKNRVGHDFI